MSYDIAAVDVNTFTIYSFKQENETEEELLKRANKNRMEKIESYMENIKNGWYKDFYERMLSQELNKDFKVMTFDEYLTRKKEHMMKNAKVTEVSEEVWESQLNVLPPIWCPRNEITMFCMSEMYELTYTTQYARYNGKYYSKLVDLSDETTWIHHFLLEKGE